MVGVVQNQRHTGIFIFGHEVAPFQKTFIPAGIDAYAIKVARPDTVFHLFSETFLAS